MKTLGLLIFTILTAACSPQNEKMQLVESFWSAVQVQDSKTYLPLLANPSQNSSGVSFELMGDSFEVLKVNGDNNVDVRFSRYCYSDIVLPTALTETANGLRIDLAETFKYALQSTQDRKPTKKYCYEFKDKPLSGVINGKIWTAHNVKVNEISFGTRTEKSVSIYAEPCPDGNCFRLKSASLNLGALDLTGEGGNLDQMHSITVFIPPNENVRITEGSYRVTKINKGITKLELAFDQNQRDRINGRIVVDAKDLL